MDSLNIDINSKQIVDYEESPKVQIDMASKSFLEIEKLSLTNEGTNDLPPKKVISKQKRMERRTSQKQIEQQEITITNEKSK